MRVSLCIVPSLTTGLMCWYPVHLQGVYVPLPFAGPSEALAKHTSKIIHDMSSWTGSDVLDSHADTCAVRISQA